MQIFSFSFTEPGFAVMERIPQHFLCHPAESLPGSDMKRAVWSGFHLTNIFIISHSWHRGDRVGITHSPVSALN